MRVNKALSMFNAIIKTTLAILGWAFLGAAVGATASGLYGVLFGMLEGMIHADFSRLALAGLYFFALCGAVAGALTGGFVRMIDPEGVADLTSRSPHVHAKMCVVFLNPSTTENSLTTRQPLLECSSSDRRSRFRPSLN